MSTLNITALTPTGGTRVPVKIQLCDSNRRPISAYTSGGILVSTYEGRTNSSGVLSIDIPANTTGILTSGGTPLANTYYLVTVGPFTRLIRKTTSTQTLAAAEVTSTEELDPAPSLNSLTDVDTATTPPTNGQALVYNTSSGLWLPGTISAGTVDVVSNVASSRVLGRVTAGSGDSEELTATQVRTLINVEDGATADQTAAEILAALLTVDGSGSGLDADTLDGHDTAYFQVAGAAAGGDLSGTYPNPTVVASSDTVAGKVELATTAETQTGTDTTRAVTPAGAAGTFALLAVPSTGGTGAPGSGTWTQWQVARSTTNALWLCTVGGTPGTWVQLALLPSNNLSDVASASTARTNLGLGTAATQASSAFDAAGAAAAAQAASQPLDSDLTALAGLSGVRGDIIYRDATQWQRLSAGAANQLLAMGANDPGWVGTIDGGSA